VSQNHLADGSGMVLLCKPKRACPDETGIFLANNLFSISTGEISGKKARDTCALYVPIDVQLNQKWTMDREWGIDDFRPSAGGWFQEAELFMVPRSSSGPPRRPPATDGSGKPWDHWACSVTSEPVIRCVRTICQQQCFLGWGIWVHPLVL